MNRAGGLISVLEANRARLVRYFVAHGVGDDAEDLLQELALRLDASDRPVAAPLNYIFRTATNLVIDWRRSRQQAQKRDAAWAEANDRSSEAIDHHPSSERALEARQRVDQLQQQLATLPDRARLILVSHRLEGKAQRQIADEMGVSISTVESDLRLAYRHLADLRQRWNEGGDA